MSHVFISYMREDASRVDRLSRSLEALGIEVWLDREKIKPGVPWAEAIREAIRGGAYFLACLSTHYEARPDTYMDMELTIALDELRQRQTERLWFIPVLLDGPPAPEIRADADKALQAIQWLSLHGDWDGGVAHLLSAIAPEAKAVLEQEALLGSASARARIAALGRLAAMGRYAERALPRIMEQLRHRNGTVKRSAVDAIYRIAGCTDEAVRALVEMLAFIASSGERWEDIYAVRAAMWVLTMFGEPAIEPLIRAAHEVPAHAAVVGDALLKIRRRTSR